MQLSRELDVLKYASTTHIAFAPSATTGRATPGRTIDAAASDELARKYRALEDEHSEAVRALADQEAELQQSTRRERKLKKLLTSMVETTTASDREAQRSALALQKLKVMQGDACSASAPLMSNVIMSERGPFVFDPHPVSKPSIAYTEFQVSNCA